MSADHQSMDFRFCPVCKADLDDDGMIVVSDDLPVEGDYEGDDSCLMVSGSTIHMFQHAEGSE